MSGHQPAGYFDADRLARFSLPASPGPPRFRHEPDRPTAPGLPPRPIDYPRPQPRQVMPGTAELAAAINASLARRSR